MTNRIVNKQNAVMDILDDLQKDCIRTVRLLIGEYTQSEATAKWTINKLAEFEHRLRQLESQANMHRPLM